MLDTLTFPWIDVPDPAQPTFRATTVCPDVQIWILAAFVLGLALGWTVKP